MDKQHVFLSQYKNMLFSSSFALLIIKEESVFLREFEDTICQAKRCHAFRLTVAVTPGINVPLYAGDFENVGMFALDKCANGVQLIRL